MNMATVYPFAATLVFLSAYYGVIYRCFNTMHSGNSIIVIVLWGRSHNHRQPQDMADHTTDPEINI